MKQIIPSEISSILSKSYKVFVKRNDSFWTDTLEHLSSVARRKECPDFLSSWINETMAILRDEKRISVVLLMPVDGCWGIYINESDEYLFTYSDVKNLYLSYRFYKYLKQNKDTRLMAGALLYETALYTMRAKAGKKGIPVDWNKNNGEAMRLVKTLFGNGEKSENALLKEYEKLLGYERDRKIVSLDKVDMYVEGCATSGEETMVELSVFEKPEESVIVQLAPGQKKTIQREGGSVNIYLRDVIEEPSGEIVDYKDYCKLMSLLDDYFVEVCIVQGDVTYKEFLRHLRGLDYFKKDDNSLINILLMFMRIFYKDRINRNEYLYNLMLVVEDYISYNIMKDIVYKKFWGEGKFIKNNLNAIVKVVMEERCSRAEWLNNLELNDKNIIRESAVNRFSKIIENPYFKDLEKYKWQADVPSFLKKGFKMASGDSSLSNWKMNITNELGLHKGIIGILHEERLLRGEVRPYSGFKRHDGGRIYEIMSLRVHFWKNKNLFQSGGQVYVFTTDNKLCGTAEVLDVREYSILIVLQDVEFTVPEKGCVSAVCEDDLSLQVSLEAIEKLKEGNSVFRNIIFSRKEKMPFKNEDDIDYFNKLVSEDISQAGAVMAGLTNNGITIIQGPPGTGKTTVISEIILQYLKRGKKVLLSSQTNSAVDNALAEVVKYRETNKGVGRVASTKEKISDETIKRVWIKSGRDLEIFERSYKEGYVIGATNVGTHTLSVMRGKEFDVLLMDEAGKANLIESVLPMLLVNESGKMIIVGDDKQGKPFEYDNDIVDLYIEKEEAIHRGLRLSREERQYIKEQVNKSLFERLVEFGRKSIMLKINYRSSPQIVELVSKLFYEGQLLPGNTIVPKSKSVIVVDTSKKTGINERCETEVTVTGVNKGYKNIYEAKIVVDELKETIKFKYLSAGIRPRQLSGITILTPYASQVEEIERQLYAGLSGQLPKQAIDELSDNVCTIDSFQGREDEVVIISFVRSNDNPYEVGFLNELNRINVVLSRAKRKMVLIGDFNTLMNVSKGSNSGYIQWIFKTIYKFW